MSILDDLYQPFKIQEKHLSVAALTQMKIAVIAAIPMLPFFAGLDLTSPNLPALWNGVIYMVMSISFGALFYVFLNPIANTLTRTNKNLDEWEISHKLAAHSFCFQITLWLAIGLLVTSSLLYISPVSDLKFIVTLGSILKLLVCSFMYLFLMSSAHMAWTIRPITAENELPLSEDKTVKARRVKKVEIAIIAVVVTLTYLAILAGLAAWGYTKGYNEHRVYPTCNATQ